MWSSGLRYSLAHLTSSTFQRGLGPTIVLFAYVVPSRYVVIHMGGTTMLQSCSDQSSESHKCTVGRSRRPLYEELARVTRTLCSRLLTISNNKCLKVPTCYFTSCCFKTFGSQKINIRDEALNVFRTKFNSRDNGGNYRRNMCW